MENPIQFDVVFDQEYVPSSSLDELIEKLKARGLSQGETHFLIFRRLGKQYPFGELRKHIVNAPCWAESLKQNLSIDDEFAHFFEKEE